jgi:hypothetical protein
MMKKYESANSRILGEQIPHFNGFYGNLPVSKMQTGMV